MRVGISHPANITAWTAFAGVKSSVLSRAWRKRTERECADHRAPILRKGCLLIFAVNTEGFLASRGMTALEFSSEAFEICDTKDSFATCGETFRV